MNKFKDKIFKYLSSLLKENFIPDEPFLAMIEAENSGFYTVFFVNPTKNLIHNIKQLSWSYNIENINNLTITSTNKIIAEKEYIKSNSSIEIDNIPINREGNFMYDFDFWENNNYYFKECKIHKYLNGYDKEYINYGINKMAFIVKLDDRSEEQNIDTLIKEIGVEPRRIIYNKDYTIKEKIIL